MSPPTLLCLLHVLKEHLHHPQPHNISHLQHSRLTEQDKVPNPRIHASNRKIGTAKDLGISIRDRRDNGHPWVRHEEVEESRIRRSQGKTVVANEVGTEELAAARLRDDVDRTLGTYDDKRDPKFKRDRGCGQGEERPDAGG